MAPPNVRLNPAGLAVVALLAVLSCFYMFGGLFHTPVRVSLRELLAVSIDVTQTGGAKVKSVYENKELDAKQKAGAVAQEMLTNGDIQSHRAMFYALEKAFPGVHVVSEEHDVRPIDLSTVPEPRKSNSEVSALISSDIFVPMSEVTIWIDPLDATQEYTEGLLQYVTVMACVAVYGEPKIGVIHRPFQDETYWALVGYGNSANLNPPKSGGAGETESPKEPGKTKRIIVSRSHAGKVEEILNIAYPEKAKVTAAGGAGYKILQVTANRTQDAYVHVTKIKKWDVCAPDAIIRALGGQMYTLSNNEISYDAFSAKVIPDGLVAALHDRSSYSSSIVSGMEKLETLHKTKDSPS